MSSRLLSKMSAEDPDRPIRLHPLVLLNISDHITRMKYLAYHRAKMSSTLEAEAAAAAAAEKSEVLALAPVMGVLFGSISSGAVELITSYECMYKHTEQELKRDAAIVMEMGRDDLYVPQPSADELAAMRVESVKWTEASQAAMAVARTAGGREGGNGSSKGQSSSSSAASALLAPLHREWAVRHIDWDAVSAKRERLHQVFPELDVVGWYTVGATTNDVKCCAALHKGLCDMMDEGDGAMIGVMVDPAPRVVGSGLSVHALETRLLHAEFAQDKEKRRGEEDEHEATDTRIKKRGNTEAALSSQSGAATFTAAISSCGEGREEVSLAAPSSTSTSVAAEGKEAAREGKAAFSRDQLYVTFKNTRFTIHSEVIEHIGVNAAMNVDLQERLPPARTSSHHKPQQADSSQSSGRIEEGEEKSNRMGRMLQREQQGDGSTAARAVDKDEVGKRIKPNLGRVSQALRTLHQRVDILVRYLELLERQQSLSANDGTTAKEENVETVAMTREVLREVYAVCANLPCEAPRYVASTFNYDLTENTPHTSGGSHDGSDSMSQLRASMASVAQILLNKAGTVKQGGSHNGTSSSTSSGSQRKPNCVVGELERTLLAALLSLQAQVSLEMGVVTREHNEVMSSMERTIAWPKSVQEERRAGYSAQDKAWDWTDSWGSKRESRW